MAKEAGIGWTTLEVDDASSTARDIKNDITSLSWATPRGVQDVTGLDKSARETLLLLADFSGTFALVFNDATNQGHDVCKTVASASVARTMTMVVSGQTLANEVNLTDYAVSRSAGGELTASVPFVLQSGTAPTWS